MMDAIYNFSNGSFANYLKSLLKENVLVNESHFQLEIIENLSYEGIIFNKSYSLEEDNLGFFVRSKNNLYRTFLYLRSYKIQHYGYYPKYHLFQCETFEQYPSANYVLSNQDSVTITDSQTGEIHEDIKLEMCRNCARKFENMTTQNLYGKSFSELVLDLEEKRIVRPVDISSDGYLWNWAQISEAYRKGKKYTCERCHITITKQEDRYFMETHHKDYNKQNNKRDNLECLCVLCHANVDHKHKYNYSKGINRDKVNLFKQEYSDDLHSVGNVYL
ncbi:MAG: hypothetical protein JJT94_04060 [Bernardetiaceae bacterium]|nr:hypothetical protein [Bernardetiaceae bacterium]